MKLMQRTAHNYHIMLILMILKEYPAWSTDANDIENTNQAQYRSDRQEILTAWQKDKPIKTSDYGQVLDNLKAYV